MRVVSCRIMSHRVPLPQHFYRGRSTSTVAARTELNHKQHIPKAMSTGSNLKIQTNTHVLSLFPGNPPDVAPYYVLADKKRPELATPLPVQPHHEIKIQQSHDSESKDLKLTLGDVDMGEYSGSDDQQAGELADFVASWRNVLSNLESPLNSKTSSRSSSKSPRADRGRINEALKEHKSELFKDDTVTMRVITWNMHGEPINQLHLGSLLGLPVMADIYVLALQESDTLGPKNLYANVTTLNNTKDAVLGALGSGYSVVGSNQLLGLMLLVFATEKVQAQVSDVKRATTGTGLFGVWGNKGAAAVWMTLGAEPAIPESGVNLALVNCHLSAGDGKSFIERRKWELGEISKKLSIEGMASKLNDFDADAPVFDVDIEDDMAKLDIDKNPANSASTTPLTFVMGDLNYRITMDAEMVKDFVDKEDFETIVVQDQLRHSIKDDRILQGFTEGEIAFAPSYKYVVGTDNYDNSERTPSYTDRILYSANCSEKVNQLEYRSVMDYDISDHKPVVSKFELTLPLIDLDKRKEVIDQALKDYDQMENSQRPLVSVEPQEVSVNNCKVLQKSEAWITLTHNSESESGLVNWELVLCSNNGQLDTESLIMVEPKEGVLPCGATQKIRFVYTPSVFIPDMSQIAIVKIVNGQDIFVPIEFKSDATCLGRSLDLLSRMPDGAKNGKIMDKANTNMPTEVWKCVDYLWSRIVPDIFEQRGDESLQAQIQDWLDNGEAFDVTVLEQADKVHPNISTFSVAQQFLILLRYVSGGVIPVEYYNSVIKADDQAVNLLLETMPGVNVNVLIYIGGFLHKAINEGCDEKQIMDIFEPLLISQPKNRDFLNRDRKKRREFLKKLILES